MEARLYRLSNIFLVDCETKLGTYPSRNADISMAFWKGFDEQLRMYHVKQGEQFVKYAFTQCGPQGLTYACAVLSAQLYPDHFQIYRVPKGEYLCAEHHGDMAKLSETIDRIFRQELKDGQLTPAKGAFVCFEEYNEWFYYRQDALVIELYIPLAGNACKSMEETETKTILQRDGNTIGQFSWFGMDFSVNLYKGCNHGCIYCDSKSSYYRVQGFDRVWKKKNELLILKRQLKRKQKKGVTDIGAMPDTYNPFEEQQEITRGALQLVDRYRYGVGIDTKSTLVLRDLDLLARVASHNPVIIKLTVTCADNALGRMAEPYALSSNGRSLTLEELHRAGIYTGISMMPVLPFISDTSENITGIVELATKHHAKFIHPAFGMTLQDNQRDYYYYQLDHYFPGRRRLYERHYHNAYSCDSPHAAKLYKLFQAECRKYGIRYHMNDITRGYKKQQVQQEQLKLQSDTDAISTVN